MFEELIQSEKEVNIYYGGEKVCISGIITDYHKQYELIRLNTQGMVLPVHGITKIEIVDDSPCSALFSKHQLLRHDCDFDNAMFMSASVSVWKDGIRIRKGAPIRSHNADSVTLGHEMFPKKEYTFRIE